MAECYSVSADCKVAVSSRLWFELISLFEIFFHKPILLKS